MLHVLKRHPIPIQAFLRQSLVLTYAFPSELLQPLLSPGLSLDTYGWYGFLAIALVQTEKLHPAFLPTVLGGNFFLSGYRLFTRFGTCASSLRGLRILRTDSNSRWMVNFGNIFTHYQYSLCDTDLSERDGVIDWNIRTPGEQADLRVIANTHCDATLLPPESPFLNLKEARRFAGPLPYTFDYERETHSIVRIRGVRQHWNPKPVAVEVFRNTFLHREPFCRATPILASAFHVHDIPYRWNCGVRTALERA